MAPRRGPISRWPIGTREHWTNLMQQADINRLVFDRCTLCGKSSDLQSSHTIPSFVFDWLRDTSATGLFRFAQSPSLRVQDGLKPRMLCTDCEQLFASWEKTFSEECFVPLNDGAIRNLSYGPWMLKFATSVSWRVLRVFVAIDGLSGFPDHIKVKVNVALEELSQFLLGTKLHPGLHEQHMFVVDIIDHSSIADLPPNINRYLSRAIDIDVAFAQDDAISYAKMGRFVLFGFVSMKYPRRWKETKLHVRHGKFGQQDIELPLSVGEFIFGRARLAAERYSQITDRQQARIRRSYEQNPSHAAKSETLRALHRDVSMFGMTAFEATQPGARRCLENDK